MQPWPSMHIKEAEACCALATGTRFCMFTQWGVSPRIGVCVTEETCGSAVYSAGQGSPITQQEHNVWHMTSQPDTDNARSPESKVQTFQTCSWQPLTCSLSSGLATPP